MSGCPYKRPLNSPERTADTPNIPCKFYMLALRGLHACGRTHFTDVHGTSELSCNYTVLIPDRTANDATQRLRANSMDAAAAANKSTITSSTSGAAQGEDPATRGRMNRDKERAKRDAKRKAASATARARLGRGPDSTGRAKKERRGAGEGQVARTVPITSPKVG